MNEKINAIVEKIKELYDKAVSFVADQWESNRTIFLAVCALIVCIPLILIVVLGMGSSGKDAPKPGSSTEVTDYIYLPAEPEMGKEYILSREQQSQWSDEEAQRWFVEPDGKMMNDMRAVNDKLINDLLEAVP